jgi:type I restriction enzyme S subunit
LQRVARITPTSQLTPEFMFLLLRGVGFCNYLEPIFTGISVPHLSPEQIKAFTIALPTVAEQQDIVAHLGRETEELDHVMGVTRREIECLLEFRTRLIADVVTGKLDVRAAAVRLPDVVAAEAVDEATDDEDLEEKTDDLEAEEVAA